MRAIFSVVCIASLCLPVGCGGGADIPTLGTVSGTVTNGGAAVADAIVTFTPVGTGRPSSGKTDTDGSYTLLYNVDNEGALPGEHTVSVVAAGSEKGYQEADNPGDDDEAAGSLPASASDGSIKKTVKAGDNEIDIAL